MIEVTPLARANAALLGLLNVPFHGITTNRELAQRLDRDESNVAKSIKALTAAGLLTAPEKKGEAREATDLAREMLAALAAEPQPEPAADPVEGFAYVLHNQITPDPQNARQKFDPEELAELANSIATVGLLQPPIVRPIEGQLTPYQLAAGERRFRAIGLLIEDGRWPADKPLTCKVVTSDEADAALIGLTENMQRKDLNLIEEARAIARTIEDTGATTADVAIRLSKSQRWVQLRLQLLDLPEIQQVAIVEGKLGFNDALKAVRNLPRLREDLTAADWLVLLEIYDKAQREVPGDSSPNVRCNLPQGEDAEAYARVSTGGQALAYGVSKDYGDDVGLYKVSYWSWTLKPQLELKFGPLDDEALREAALRRARSDVLGEPCHRQPTDYMTAWLHGPFIPDPDLVAEDAANKARWAEEDAQRKAAQAARQERQATARQGALAFLDAQRREIAGVAADEFVSPNKREDLAAGAAEAMGLPLPWTPTTDGKVIAANGAVAWEEPWNRANDAPAKAALVAGAVNAAANLPTPDPLDPSATLARNDFAQAVAAALVELTEDTENQVGPDVALDMALLGVAALLAGEGVEYGAPSLHWNHEAAEQLALDIFHEGLGQAAGEDLETETV